MNRLSLSVQVIIVTNFVTPSWLTSKSLSNLTNICSILYQRREGTEGLCPYMTIGYRPHETIGGAPGDYRDNEGVAKETCLPKAMERAERRASNPNLLRIASTS